MRAADTAQEYAALSYRRLTRLWAQGSGTLLAPGASAVAVTLHLGELLPQYQLTRQDVATLTLAALADIWKVSALAKTAS